MFLLCFAHGIFFQTEFYITKKTFHYLVFRNTCKNIYNMIVNGKGGDIERKSKWAAGRAADYI